MTRTALLLAVLATALVSVLSALPAQAQRVFVAAQGSDTNPCTFAAPCRSFQQAHNTVAAGGEIDVLDPAGYGTLNIIKAISIQGHGYSGISVGSGGTGITVNAGATDKINLNGLLIDGAGVGTDGIQFIAGQSLTIENCAVRNLSVDGLRFNHASNTLATLSISNSYFTDNGSNGVFVEPTGSGPTTAALAWVILSGNGGAGLDLAGGFGTGALSFAVTDSVAANNGATGFAATSETGQSVTNLVLTRSTASGNGTGIAAIGVPATLRVAQSTVTENTVGYQISVGAILSYGDNYIDVNGSNTGTLGTATKQ
jgi:hypothetical protein